MYDKLTENDIKKMQEEIDYRKLVVRPKELEAVKEARAQGDLSENFEYKAAKQDKNRNESRGCTAFPSRRTASKPTAKKEDLHVKRNGLVRKPGNGKQRIPRPPGG